MKLDDSRARIDEIDRELLRLFTERMNLAGEIASYKKEHGLPIYVPEREQKILAEMTAMSREEFSPFVRVFFQELMDLSKLYQANQSKIPKTVSSRIRDAILRSPGRFPVTGKVACQGLPGAYSETAAKEILPGAEITFHESFENVFRAIRSGDCDYGILPVENSTYGSVSDVYDLLRKYRFNIVRSVKINIKYALLVSPETDPKMITDVFSHPQAIAQCSHFLRDHPEIRFHALRNTEEAAKCVAEHSELPYAAIASVRCGQLYGLRPLREKVMNAESNYTRFVCISGEPQAYADANRISLMVTLSNRPGALYLFLARLAGAGINLTKLESRPAVGSDFEAMYFMDFEASPADEDVLCLLDMLAAECGDFVFLGSYHED